MLLICLFSAPLFAQENNYSQKSDFWNHVRFGGGIGLSFGNNFFSGTLAPSAIYQFNRQFALGVGLSGTYNSQKNYYKSTIIGGSIIGLFNPINEMVSVLNENNITLQKVVNDKKRIVSILENYSNKIGYRGGTKKFIREVIQKLPKV